MTGNALFSEGRSPEENSALPVTEVDPEFHQSLSVNGIFDLYPSKMCLLAHLKEKKITCTHMKRIHVTDVSTASIRNLKMKP